MGTTGLGTSFLLLTAVAVAGQPETAMEWNQRGIEASQRNDLRGAEHDYLQAMALWRALGPAYEPHAATTLYNLSQAIIGQGRWRESVPLLEESVKLGRRTLGLSDPRTLASLATLGRVYMITGVFDRSAEALSDVLRVEREKSPETIELAQTLGSLAALRTREGKLDNAQTLADEGLAVAIRASGDNSAETATQYAIVAAIHQRAGRTDRAIPLFRKAHAIYDRTIAPQDLRYTSLLTGEALAWVDDGHLREADSELKRAIELLSHGAQNANLGLAIAETNMGVLRMAQKKYAEADRYFESALAREGQYSVRGGDLLQTLKLVADLRQRQHRYRESLALKQRIAQMQTAYKE